MNYTLDPYGSTYIPQQYTNNYTQPQHYSYGQQTQSQNDGSIIAFPIHGGEATASLYPVGSGNTVLLIDFELGKAFLKSNVNGIPQRLRLFSFIEDQPQDISSDKDNVTRKEFNDLTVNVDKLTNSINKLLSDLGGGVGTNE